MKLNKKFSRNRANWQLSWLLLMLGLYSLLLGACSDSPTTAPNPLPSGTGAATDTGTPGATSAANSTPAAAATSQPDSNSRPNQVGADNRQVVRLWTGGWKGNTDYEAFLNNVVDSYRSKYSKTFTLDWQDFGTNLDNKLADTLAKNPKNLPDLVLLDVGNIYQFAAAGKLEDLAPLVGSEVQSRFHPVGWDALRYGQGDNSGAYGLPWLASTRVSIINKKLWQQATLDPTKLPKNFDDLDQALPLMRDKTPLDVRAVWLKPDPVADFLMEDTPLYSKGPDAKFVPTFNIANAQGKWQYYFNRRKDGYFSNEALEGTNKDALSRYSAGKLVMVMDGAPLLPDLKTQNAELYANTLVTLHPLSKANVLPLQIQGWSMLKDGPNKREALPFALFLDSDENQLAFAKLAQISIPTAKKALQDTFVQTSDDPLSQARAIMVQALPQTRPAEQLIPAPLPLTTRDKLLNALVVAQGATWAKAVKPQDALAEAAKAWTELLK